MLDGYMVHLLSRFLKWQTWSIFQNACDQWNLPFARTVQSGCVKIIFDSMTPEQAQALLTVYHNGKLKALLNKVLPFFSHVKLHTRLETTVESNYKLK